jgi:adenylate kinase
MDAGRLVPDDLVLKILNERLAQPDAQGGFILDGFPRNLAQALELAKTTSVDAVVSFDIPANRLIERLSGRRLCPACQSVYNLATRPPRNRGRCDRDGTELIQRPDDRPDAISTRLAVYAEQTAPLLGHYRAAGLLTPVDATGTPDEVAARVRTALHGV